jgi:thiol-disulfide isomerase/thioredoxin
MRKLVPEATIFWHAIGGLVTQMRYTRLAVRRTIATVGSSATVTAAIAAMAFASQGPGAPACGSTQERSLATSVRSGDGANAGDPELRRQLKSLIRENENASLRYGEAFKKLKTDGEKKAYVSTNWPTEKQVVGRMLELARLHPEDPTSFDALAWIVDFGYNTAESDDAAVILATRYGADRRLWLITQDMRRGVISLGRGVLFEAVLKHSSDRATRGRACLDLAQYDVELANFTRILKTPGMRPWQAQAYTEERLDPFRKLEPTQLDAEAGRLYERVMTEFADVVPIKWGTVPSMRDSDPRTVYEPKQDDKLDSGTLADRARPALKELRALSVGRVAPEIDGPDIDGHRFKLSDFRGRVVILTFSGTWCGPCEAMYPHQREIVSRLKGRPFALLSVMTDAEAGPIRKEIESGVITWRCWWERGGTEGAIPTAWNVHGFPTVYVLDQKGVIRLKFTGLLAPLKYAEDSQPPIDEFIDRLLTEQEAKAE